MQAKQALIRSGSLGAARQLPSATPPQLNSIRQIGKTFAPFLVSEVSAVKLAFDADATRQASECVNISPLNMPRNS